MVMEHFVTPFVGIPFPMQASSETSSPHGSSKVSSSSKHSSRKNCRKRRKLSGMKRIAATTRERSRIEHLNLAFITLRSRIPTQPSDVKLTKVETLRLAMSYISHLEKLVGEISEQEKGSIGSSEVSSTSEIKTSREDGVACPRVVRVYPSYPVHSEHSEYGSWNPQYGLPVRPIPTMDSHFILKKGDKN
ncbi:transcription factor 15-like [Bolinopsis microptera]|uniref:transcription factor 15-like n=1 Tax=Bolinopsis microptera TaxID=2820187 RepID=UPI00307A1357